MYFFRLIQFSALLGFSASLHADSAMNYNFRSNIHHTGERVPGLEFSTGLEFPFSFSNSQSRLGVSDGNYIQIEGRSLSFFHFLRGKHDWSSSFFLNESFSMSPSIEDRWIKAKDTVQFETRYLYNFVTWAGAYAHARLTSSLFSGIDVHDKQKTYEIRDVNDKKREQKKATEYYLSDPFFPFYLEENFGLFAVIVEETPFTWETRAAFSLRQTFADNQKVFVDDSKDLIIIRDLASFFQAGPLLGTALGGNFLDSNLFYNVGIDAMWPLWQTPAKTRSFSDSIIWEGNGGIGFILNKYVDINYEYSMKRIPDILEKFQQEHAVHVSLSIDWVYKFGEQPNS